MGLVMAWIIKQFFWVPYRFQYGILAAGTWGNYGDIRAPLFFFVQTSALNSRSASLATSVVMSITAGPPFNSNKDQTLAVAYVSAFIFVFFVSLIGVSIIAVLISCS